MKIGMFGYPGDNLARVKAMYNALRERGAETIICQGGLIWSGRRGEAEGDPPATVLRWLRGSDIIMLCNDMDRQVAGWRLQSLECSTGYIKPRVRKFLAAITREEGQWIYGLPEAKPLGKVLCCADNLMVGAMFPIPLSRFNTDKLFNVLEQKVAFFPSAHGPTLVVRQQEDGAIEAARFDGMEEKLDAPKMAVIFGGVTGFAPLNADYSWGAVVDSDVSEVSLVCLDVYTLKSIPEQGNLLVHRSEFTWK